MFFGSSSLGDLLDELWIDQFYQSDGDIENLVRQRIRVICEDHPLKNRISRAWPSSEAIRTLVWRSSGRDLYAKVAVRHLASDDHFPPERLVEVLQLRPARRNLPFAELDALYSHIISCVRYTQILRTLCVALLFDKSNIALELFEVKQLCDLSWTEYRTLSCDLRALLEKDPAQIRPHQFTPFVPKSLSDYLQDPARSHDFHIDATPRKTIPIITRCLELVSGEYAIPRPAPSIILM